MKIREIEALFDRVCPVSRRCPWDNDGLLVCPDREREVRRVVTCLDVTFPAIEKAIKEKAELIVSHHPLIFSPIKSVNEDTVVGQKILLLIENGISLLSLHTRLDNAKGGLNEEFGRSFGVVPEEDVILLPEEPFVGGIGSIADKMSPRDLARTVSAAVLAPVKLYSAHLDISRVGYCCGSGKDLIVPCLECGADAFVGGDLPYHAVLDAVERGMTVIDCGHHASETMASVLIQNLLLDSSPLLEIFPFREALGGEIIDFS